MKKKFWLIAGVTGMLLGMPQFTAQAHYGDGFEHRHGDYRRYDGDRYDRYDRYDRRHDRGWYEREERRRRWREEERRRWRHRHDDHRSGVYIRL